MVDLEHRLIWMRTAARFLFYVAALLTTIVFFHIGPRIEATVSPVVEHFEITRINPQEDGRTYVRGIMFKPKARAHCEFLGLTVTTTNNEDPDKIVQVEFEPNDTFDTRPPGSQEFGPWTLFRPEPPLGQLIIFQSTHRCHPLWDVTTELFVGHTQDFFPRNKKNTKSLTRDKEFE